MRKYLIGVACEQLGEVIQAIQDSELGNAISSTIEIQLSSDRGGNPTLILTCNLSRERIGDIIDQEYEHIVEVDILYGKRIGKYRHEELHAAFTEICNKEHWKLPFEAEVPSDKLDLYDEAAVYITGGHLTRFRSRRKGMTLVKGKGYYHHIGS